MVLECQKELQIKQNLQNPQNNINNEIYICKKIEDALGISSIVRKFQCDKCQGKEEIVQEMIVNMANNLVSNIRNKSSKIEEIILKIKTIRTLEQAQELLLSAAKTGLYEEEEIYHISNKLKSTIN